MNPLWISLAFFLAVGSQFCDGQEETQCLCLQEMVQEDELRAVMRMKPFPDGSGKLVIAEGLGALWVYSGNFTRQPEPFANFTHLIDTSRIDSGFQGLAFHPNFPDDGRVFVNFNMRDENGDYGTLRQYHVSTDTEADVIDMNTEVILIGRNRESNGDNENCGGEVFFGKDGYLYVAYGDGSQGDPLDMAQNRGEMRGKVLRLDIDNVPEGQTYGIPPDNPFIDEEGTLPEIYALGFRQPWSASVDPGDPETGQDSGRIFLADCGQRSWEEIDLVVKGGNYGWPSREGNACYKYRYCGEIGPEEYPIGSYNHDEGAETFGRCAIGGSFYRGSLNPGLQGLYVHGDTGIRRRVFVMREALFGGWFHYLIPFCNFQTCNDLGMSNTRLQHLTNVETDSDGEIYILSANTTSGGYGVRIQKLVDPETYVP